jgi:lipoprotein-anchoring transpeptidase ErfK/SrfK
MQRSGLLVLATVSLIALPVPASAQGYGEPNLGGGFIEFLFGGGQARPHRYQQQPAYPAEPAPYNDGYQRAPGYYQPGSYHSDYGQPPMIQRSSPQQMTYGDPAAAQARFDPRYQKQVVSYDGAEKPGTIIVDTPRRFLFLVQEDGKAIRYGIGVGRPGFTWAGVKSVTRKAEWPDWVPPKEMLARRPDLPHFMAGGPENPLGARALYLGSSLYRIHGSNEPWTIGQAVSSGCIRMRNEDVVDLYERVKVGTRVIVI